MLTPATLRARRRELRLSQAALAAELGGASNTVARWERGEKPVGHPDWVIRVLERLEAPAPQRQLIDGPGHRAHNLPSELSSFIGREREVDELRRRLLGNTRLLTLTGAGGIGKTRLALRVASELVSDFRDGIWLLQLAPLGDPGLIPRAVALTLGVPEQPERALPTALADYLHRKQMLLVFDNCEHLVAACAELADLLLRACPSLHILATSREPLGIAGEATWQVTPLSLPDSHLPQPVEQMMQHEAVRLLAQRAVAREPSFVVTEQNAPAVLEVCRRLDGIRP